MGLTKEEAQALKAHIITSHEAHCAGVGLTASGPGTFGVKVNLRSSSPDSLVETITRDAVAFARDQLGKDCDEQAVQVGRIGAVKGFR